MRMKRWREAYEAFVGSARVVEGRWREVGELRERMRICRREVEVERDEKMGRRVEENGGKVKRRVRKGVRFEV